MSKLVDFKNAKYLVHSALVAIANAHHTEALAGRAHLSLLSRLEIMKGDLEELEADLDALIVASKE